MSWSIGCIKNTVEVSNEVATDIFYKLVDELELYSVEDILDDGKLYFNNDHMEHMDYVWHVDDALAKAGCVGEIAFASVEGDNAGDWWKYTFADGKCVRT